MDGGLGATIEGAYVLSIRATEASCDDGVDNDLDGAIDCEMEHPFPAFATLVDDDTPASAYDLATNTWDTSMFVEANGSFYDASDAAADDADLMAWLDGQQGPLPAGGTGVFNASAFEILDSWTSIQGG